MSKESKREAHDYAERIRARLPRRLQEALEAVPMSKYALELESGITREMLGRIERGKAIPGLILTAQISHGLGLTLTEFVRELEDDAEEVNP